jgi:hypothetical protein
MTADQFAECLRQLVGEAEDGGLEPTWPATDRSRQQGAEPSSELDCDKFVSALARRKRQRHMSLELFSGMARKTGCCFFRCKMRPALAICVGQNLLSARPRSGGGDVHR